jgi:hypothetical protein
LIVNLAADDAGFDRFGFEGPSAAGGVFGEQDRDSRALRGPARVREVTGEGG